MAERHFPVSSHTVKILAYTPRELQAALDTYFAKASGGMYKIEPEPVPGKALLSSHVHGPQGRESIILVNTPTTLTSGRAMFTTTPYDGHAAWSGGVLEYEYVDPGEWVCSTMNDDYQMVSHGASEAVHMTLKVCDRVQPLKVLAARRAVHSSSWPASLGEDLPSDVAEFLHWTRNTFRSLW